MLQYKKFAVLALIFVLIGCVRIPNSPDSSEIENLVPLNVGNFWDYEFKNQIVLRDSVKSKEEIENQDVYFLETDMGSWTAGKAIYNTLNGYFEINGEVVSLPCGSGNTSPKCKLNLRTISRASSICGN